MTKSIQELLNAYVQQCESWQLKIVQQWSSIIGDLYERVTVEKVTHDTLILGVYDSSWMHELYMLSPVLLQTINKKLDKPYIKHLRFKKVSARKKNIQQVEEKDAKEQIPKLSGYEMLVLKKVEDPELRDALHAFRIRCYKENI